MAPENKSHLGEDFRKAQPKLRLVTNGDRDVNAARALQCGALAVTGETLEKKLEAAPPTDVMTDDRAGQDAAKGKQDKLPSDISVNVFVQTTNFVEPGKYMKLASVLRDGQPEGDSANAENVTRETAQNSNLATARVRMSDLPKLLENNMVVHVDLAENLKAPNPEIGTSGDQAPHDVRKIMHYDRRHQYGKGVLIGIIDVGGFDFSHPDFIDAKGETRFFSIWDQGGERRPDPFSRRQAMGEFTSKTFNYGSEITREHMNAAIKAASNLGLQPYQLEPQSQMSSGSHGTHVASIAAGKSGLARNAVIAGVVIGAREYRKDGVAEETEYQKRRKSFYDSTQIVHAVDYLVEIADFLNLPLSINISLGTNGHSHDGTSPACRWIDAWLTKRPGTSVTVAAGNAGQEAGIAPGDMGYVVGRVHTSGKIPSRGLTTDIEWQVIGDGSQDMSENELEIWYSAQDIFGVQIKPPGQPWTEVIEPLQFIENRQLPNKAFFSIYNEIYHAANGLNCISIYLSPNLKVDPPIGSEAGLWKIRLHGIEIRNGKFHGWIERDDPRKMRLENGREVMFLPSFFSGRSNVDNSSVNSLACGQRIISVANLDEPAESINITSSQGPTRDGRTKPDIAAPGTAIVAAKGFSNDSRQWVDMSGTSMAAPYVAGLIGLMLGANPKLTAAQIEGIVQSTARPLPGHSYEWIDSAGFGRIDPQACLEKAMAVDKRKDITE